MAARPIAPNARDTLDLSVAGEAVVGRRRPLVARTLERISAGMRRTAKDAPWSARGHRAFVMRNNGSTSDGAEHCTSIDEPLRTLTTAGHQSVVTFRPSTSQKKMLEGARMRFLTVAEMAAGMGFPADYRLGGSLDEQRTMLGNAVTPPAARDLIAMVREAVTS